MKKVSIIVIVSLILVFSFPVISLAEIRENSFELHSLDSVAGIFDDSTLQTYQNHITPFDDDSKISSIYSAISSFSLTNYIPMLYGYSYEGGNLRLIVYAVHNSVTDVRYFSYGNIATDISTAGIIQLQYSTIDNINGYEILGQSCEYNFSNNTWNYNSTYTTTIYGYTDNRKAIGYIGSSNHNFVLLDSNCPIYSSKQYEDLGGSNINTSSDLFTFDVSNLIDFMGDNLPYVNSDGNIVHPAPIEPVIDKSIAFRKIDLSTIYSYTAKAHCAGLLAWEIDPVGYSIIDENLAGWTMHYNITVNYKWTTAMDTWIYQPFYSGGAASGSIVWDIDIEPTGSIKANEQVIDIYDLLNTYPVARGNAQNINDVALAVYALKNGKGSVWGDVFGQSGSDISNIASEISSKNLFSVNGYSSSQINSIFNPTYSYALTNLDLQVVCYPVNNTAHIKGKTGTTKLNLVTNTSSSYAQGAEVTDENTGTDVISPDYNNNTDDVVQPVSSNGSIVYVVINNPLSGTSGSGSSSSSSSSSPSINVDVGGGTYAFDPGYEDLKNDIIAQDNNWATYFDPFVDEENGAGELTGTVLTYLPSEMKTIFISGFGVLTLLAIYRYIRRG